MGGKLFKISAVVFLLVATLRLGAIDFYAAPAGTTATGPGTGTITNPWALQTALSQPSAVHPGDTIWLRGGTYTGNFTSYLTGTVRAPIVVRQYPGERATLDGNVSPSASGSSAAVLSLNGSGGYTWYWGFEVTNSSPVRTDTNPCTYCRGDGIDVFAAGTKIINCIVHDAGQGIGNWTTALNSELYGNFIYFNGYVAPDRTHGHGIYTQNYNGGSKLIKQNFIFDTIGPGSLGIQATGSAVAGFKDSAVTENVFSRARCTIGGLSPAFSLSGSSFTNNKSWDIPVDIGYFSEDVNPFDCTDNYLVNLKLTNNSAVFGSPIVTGRRGYVEEGNTFIGESHAQDIVDFPDNTYIATDAPPVVDEVFVIPNQYEAGRATVVIYNWDGSSTQSVDVTGVLSVGGAYEIRNAQNFYGPPVVSGWYAGGSVTVPMTGLTPSTPVGFTARAPTGPAFNTFVVLPADGTFMATRILPVIVDAAGQNGAHFSTEVTLANRGVTPALISLTYTASPQFGGPSGTVTDELLAGRQLVIPDAISYLRSRGLPFGGGSQGGTLKVTFTGLSSPEASYAAARITSPSGSGRVGTAFASVRPEDGFDGKAIVFGLRESDRERSNLALVNLAPFGSITLDLTAFSGDADGRTASLTPVTLGHGEWIQLGSPLAAAGFDNGFIEVERSAGAGRFFTYGVINDNVTNDGAFIPPVPEGTRPEEEILPVVVENGAFNSDLVVTNPGSQPVTVTLSYVESLAFPAGGTPLTTSISLGAFEQRLIPSAIDFFRQQGLNIGPSGAAAYAGAVEVQFSRDGVPALGYAGALTASPAPQGGRYGVFYNAAPVSRAAAGDAWVYGLQQNDTTRSNLAIASAGDAGEPVTFHLEVYDGDSGRLAGQLGPFVVPSRGWVQLQHVLTGFGVSNGYVRVIGTTGADRLVAYGVVNDGATSSSGRTNDGSFIPSPTK